jgi:succinate dehydrogenase/fumarate reductase flavoprotein subunit
MHLNEVFDVVVAGFGYAGGITAIAAHDAGASVLLLEKQRAAGGISVCSAGGVRCSIRPVDALQYLLATNGGTTPEPVMRALAEGMAELPDFVRALAAPMGAGVSIRQSPGNYPFPGEDAFGFANVDAVPDFDPTAEYPAVRGSPAGARLFKVVHENVQRRGIEVRLGCPAERLLFEGGRVMGVIAGGPIRARGGVVLATGGFEAAPGLQRQFWPTTPTLSAACLSNTATACAWRRRPARRSGTCGTTTAPMGSGTRTRRTPLESASSASRIGPRARRSATT